MQQQSTGKFLPIPCNQPRQPWMHLHCCHTSPLLHWEMKNKRTQHMLLSYIGRIRSENAMTWIYKTNYLRIYSAHYSKMLCILLWSWDKSNSKLLNPKNHSGKDLNYEDYCSLLLSAAHPYDAQLAVMAPKWSKEGSMSTIFSFLTTRISQICHMSTMTLICL